MLTQSRPILRVIPATDIGDGSDAPSFGLGPKVPACWHLMGERHHGSLKTGKPLHKFTDPTRPPTEADLVARFGPDFRPCKCRQCRGAYLVFAWWGKQAADILEGLV